MIARSISPSVVEADLVRIIAGAADVLCLDLGRQGVDRLVSYVRLMERWNATYNLTAIRDPASMAKQHVADCLAAAAALARRIGGRPARVLDVGSGAGLPGLVLALAVPAVQATCIDSVGKKTAFITHAAGALGLSNVDVCHARVETLRGEFDVVASRAFGTLADFLSSTAHLLVDGGVWMAMKGKPPVVELEALGDKAFHVEPITVPGLNVERCIVWVTK